MLKLSDALESIKMKLPSTTFQRFTSYLDMTGFRKHDKCIIPFFLLPINDREKFMDFSKTNWNSDNTKRNAISAVSSALDTDIVKQKLKPEQYEDIKKALQECMLLCKSNKGIHNIQDIHNTNNNDYIENIENIDEQNLVDTMDIIHKELKHFGSNLSSIANFNKSVHEHTSILNNKIQQLELERDQLKEENLKLVNQLALASNSNNALSILTSLKYSIDILLALYKDSCQSPKTYETFEAIIRKQITGL